VDALLGMRINLASADAMAVRFDNQVAEAVSRSPEIASYVHQLEEQQQNEEQEEETQPTSGADLPSGEALVQELEEFLRRRKDDDEPDQDR
jgi:hypothetical protein